MGPFVGGYLVSAASWRWIFLVNLPVGAFVLTSTLRHVPESRDAEPSAPFDWRGAILVVPALAGLTFGLIEGVPRGWGNPVVVVSLVLAAACTAGFLVTEHRRRSPLLPLSLFRSRQLVVTNGVTFIVYGGLGGVLFLLPVELQIVRHYSPLESGVALLPITVVMLLFSSASGRLAVRIGPRLQMGTGPAVVGIGLGVLGLESSFGDYWSGVLPAVLVFAAGLALTVAPLTATALSSAPASRAGVASALNNVVARVGGLVAVAVVPAAAGIVGRSYLHGLLLARGFRSAAIIAGAACVVAGVVAAVGIRNPERKMAPVLTPPQRPALHCALDAPPMGGSVT